MSEKSLVQRRHSLEKSSGVDEPVSKQREIRARAINDPSKGMGLVLDGDDISPPSTTFLESRTLYLSDRFIDRKGFSSPAF